MRCFEKYLYLLIISLFLIIPVLPVTVTAAAIPLSDIPQRAVASFVPSALFSSRVLSEDSHWKGALQVDGMVTVAAQATLTIMPGTVVRFGPDSGILVLGRIVAKGTTELPILFSSYYSQPLPADWHGVVLTGTSKNNVFENLQLQGAEAAIHARSSSLELKQVRIENSLSGIILTDAIADVQDTAIYGGVSGISARQSEVDLVSVTIEKSESALSVTSSSLTAARLTISSSLKSALKAEKSQLKIDKSLFSTNLGGAVVTACQGSINTSRFIANAEIAVVLSDSPLRFSSNLVSGSKVGIQLYDNLTSIWGNSIYANSSYNILYSGDETIYLGGNWLGATNNELVNQSLFSKKTGAIKLLPLLASDPLTDPRKFF